MFLFSSRNTSYSIEREHFLEGTYSLLLTCSMMIFFLWMTLCYKFFVSQQLVIPRNIFYLRAASVQKSEMVPLALLSIAICIPWIHSSDHKIHLKHHRLFPYRLHWVLLFLLISYGRLSRTPPVGRITELPVLQVMWKVYIAGLLILGFLIRMPLKLLLTSMWDPVIYVNRSYNFPTYWRVLNFLSLFILLIIDFHFARSDDWVLPNYIYP